MEDVPNREATEKRGCPLHLLCCCTCSLRRYYPDQVVRVFSQPNRQWLSTPKVLRVKNKVKKRLVCCKTKKGLLQPLRYILVRLFTGQAD